MTCKTKYWRGMLCLMLSLLIAMGQSVYAQGITLQIDDGDTNPLQLLRDGKAVGVVNGETITYTDILFPVHPPATAFSRVNLFEDTALTELSDTLELTLTPNNDGKTASLLLTFKSDPDAVLLRGNPAPSNLVEAANGNTIIDLNSGFVDAAGNAIVPTDIGGGPLTVIVNSTVDPVPEFSSSFALMMGLGVSGVLVWRRRGARIRPARNAG